MESTRNVRFKIADKIEKSEKVDKQKNSISLNKNIMKKIKIMKSDYDSTGDISNSQYQNSSMKMNNKKGIPSSHVSDNSLPQNILQLNNANPNSNTINNPTSKGKRFTFDTVFNKKTINNSYLTNSQLGNTNNPIKNTTSIGNSMVGNNIINKGPTSGGISININNFNFNNYNINSTTRNKNSSGKIFNKLSI